MEQGAGVLAINGDVYYTCIPNLWLLKDADDDGQSLTSKAHCTVGTVSGSHFAGTTCMASRLAPMDVFILVLETVATTCLRRKGIGCTVAYCGAVFRCERDGSGLQEFAYGLRNPQELAFDDYGNLFTGDNNSDSGDLARLVYVLPESDSGWRMYYQYHG